MKKTKTEVKQYSEMVHVPNSNHRIWLNVKQNKDGKKHRIEIVESRFNQQTKEYENKSVLVFENEFPSFQKALSNAILRVNEKMLPEMVKTGYGEAR